jgi:2',3'-cyclic-nucleotide 2'-phosphodiesterase (5'-nucleotidase family)
MNRLLAQEVPEIDLILGGHDHVHINELEKNNVIIKSGTDFRELTLNRIKISKSVESSVNRSEKVSDTLIRHMFVKGDTVIELESEIHYVTKDLPEDENIAKVVKEYEMKTEETFKQVIGYFHNPIDAKFATVRAESTSISNFIADLMRIFMNTDICVINSGSLRMDSVINEGEVT